MSEDYFSIARLPSPSPPPELSIPRSRANTHASELFHEFQITGFFRALRRRKWLFLTTAILALALSGILYLSLTRKYTATALVLIENSPHLMQIESVVQGVSDSTRELKTQAEVLTSPGLAARVIDRLNLQADPEINPALAGGTDRSWLPDLSRLVEPVWRAVSALPLLSEHTSVEVNNTAGLLVERFRSLLSTSVKERSSIIEVTFSSRDPEKSTRIVNEVVNTYLHDRAERKRQDARNAASLLDDRIQTWRDKLAASEAAVEEYRQTHGLATHRGLTAVDQQLSDLNAQLAIAKADEARAYAQAGNAARRHASQSASRARELTDSPLIGHLREQEAQLIQNAAELSSVYGERHPRIQQIEAQLRDLRQKIDMEEGKILQSLAVEVQRAVARRAMLQNSIANLKQESVDSGQAELRLKELEREATASRTVYTTLLSREQEALAQEHLQDASLVGAQLVSPAMVPNSPSFPRPMTALSVSLAFATVFGLAAVLIREKLDHGVTGLEETEALTGVRVLALVPRLAKSLTRDIAANAATWARAPDFSEAMRRLQTIVSLSGRGTQAGKVLLMTSSVQGEGKSLLCASLSLQMARSGKRCALVDCDFRRSRVSAMLGSKSGPGLVHLLSGRSELSEVIHDMGELDFVPSGVSMLGEQELERINAQLPVIFGSDAMANFLTALRMRCDVVILDAPPMIVADSILLSKLVEETMFVVQWERTRRDSVLASIRDLAEHGANIKGIILTQVDVRKYSTYGYPNSMLLSRHYNER